jgi:N-acetyl-anhydromuramyl-L-alanine amidase AmpD
MSVDQPGAISMLVNEQRVFINQNNHTWCVVHKTASGGRAQDIANFFANDPAMASTHYVVGQDGTIVQCVLEKDGAGGNCCEKGNFASFLPVGQNLNTWTVSIEHVDPDPQNRTELTPAQKAASFNLIHDICVRHNIPMRRGDATGGIIGHADIDPVDRALCPNNYPWQELWNYLKGNTSMVPTGWKDANNTLTAPNGHRVVLGFRDYVLSHSWDTGNQPLEDEWHADPLEVSNPSLGAGQKQGFTWTTLEYTPARGVFEAWQSQEIIALRAQIAALKSQTPVTVPVDTTQVHADVEAIIDALPPLFAKLMLDISKL